MAFRVALATLLSLALVVSTHGASDYTNGGADWGGYCSGPNQSPIDIVTGSEEFDSAELDLFYPVVSGWSEGMKIIHDGNSISVKAIGGNMGFAYHEGRKYHVRELRFHAPGEHTINGETFPLEMQIVHQRKDDVREQNLFIISALYRMQINTTRKSSTFLDKVLDWNHLPSEEGKRSLITRAFQLGRGVSGLHGGYFRYSGSSTSEPCSPGAVWSVLETVQEVLPQQLFRINHLFKGNFSFAKGRGNNRDIQKANGRVAVLHNHKAQGDGDGLPSEPADDRVGVSPGAGEPAFDDAFTANAPPGKRPSTLPQLYASHGRKWKAPLCREGRQQSPIDIQLTQGNPHGDWEMKVNYVPANASNGIEHLGHTLGVSGRFGKLRVGDDVFEAEDLVFHVPAEHTIDGRRAAMELEIIHRRGSTPHNAQTAIVSVLFHESNSDQSDFLDSLSWHLLPYKKGQRVILDDPVNLHLLKGLRGGYYSYAGSLSTPPCSEGVQRFIVRTINEVSTWQVQQFKNRFFGNVRALQARNGRGVTLHKVNPASEVVRKFRNQPPQRIVGQG